MPVLNQMKYAKGKISQVIVLPSIGIYEVFLRFVTGQRSNH